MSYTRENLELELFPDEVKATQDFSATFAANMSLPVHKWFRYTAGFSADWAGQVIETEKANGRERVIDPFAGSGTVLLESEFKNTESIGIEAHPYIYRIANAKLLWDYPADVFKSIALAFLALAAKKIIIRYNTGDKIEGSFSDKKSAIKFLESFSQP